jgi:hypothetical protein
MPVTTNLEIKDAEFGKITIHKHNLENVFTFVSNYETIQNTVLVSTKKIISPLPV